MLANQSYPALVEQRIPDDSDMMHKNEPEYHPNHGDRELAAPADTKIETVADDIHGDQSFAALVNSCKLGHSSPAGAMSSLRLRRIGPLKLLQRPTRSIEGMCHCGCAVSSCENGVLGGFRAGVS